MTKYEKAIADSFTKKNKNNKFKIDHIMWNYTERRNLCKMFSFAIPNEDALHAIGIYGPILEVGAGTGYWAHELQERGRQVIPTDITQPEFNRYEFTKTWTQITQCNALEAIEKYHKEVAALLIIWPCYASGWAFKAAKAFSDKKGYKKSRIIYIGEGERGCTADDEFHEFLNKDCELIEQVNIPQWYSIHDYLTVWSR